MGCCRPVGCWTPGEVDGPASARLAGELARYLPSRVEPLSLGGPFRSRRDAGGPGVGPRAGKLDERPCQHGGRAAARRSAGGMGRRPADGVRRHGRLLSSEPGGQPLRGPGPRRLVRWTPARDRDRRVRLSSRTGASGGGRHRRADGDAAVPGGLSRDAFTISEARRGSGGIWIPIPTRRRRSWPIACSWRARTGLCIRASAIGAASASRASVLPW